MGRDKKQISPPPTPPTSPPCQKDRLFNDLSKYARSPHATQLVPKYGEFNLGQGDPLLQAAIDHWKKEALKGSHRQLAVANLEIEDKGSFRRSKRRMSRTKQRSLPDLSKMQTQTEHEIHEVDHLIDHGTTLTGCGMNDIVHLKNGAVLSVPCVSPQIMKRVLDNKEKQRQNHRRRHTMPQLRILSPGKKRMEKDHLIEHGSPLGGKKKMEKDHLIEHGSPLG
jgi:hypothetical protein